MTLSVLLVMSGCQTFRRDKKPELIQATVAREVAESPEKLVAVWTHTTYHQPGKPATRGLGGRIYFYDVQRKAVPVAGQLIVYGYDDSRPGGEKRTPDRKYIFTAEEFAKHVSHSDLGPSYSVWLPWDAVGGKHKEVSVVAVFTSVNGQVIMGDHTRHLLPGEKPVTADMASLPPEQAGAVTRRVSANPNWSVTDQPSTTPARLVGGAAFESPSVPESSPATQATSAAASEMRSTSIAVPPSVRQRLIHSTTAPNTVATTVPNANWSHAGVREAAWQGSHSMAAAHRSDGHAYVSPATFQQPVDPTRSMISPDTAAPFSSPPTNAQTVPASAVGRYPRWQPFPRPMPAHSELPIPPALAAPFAPPIGGPLPSPPFPATPPPTPATGQ